MRNKIAFVWQGISDPKIREQWKDGLYAAMKLLESKYDVFYHEPYDDITDVDLILYWEAPCTYGGKDRENYYKVQNNPIKKILLFAGGSIQKLWCENFDMFLVESEISEKEFSELGLPWMRAFGVNTDIMKPEKQPKVFDACFPSTCAGWKRQGLFSKALRDKGVICGRYQQADPEPFNHARANGSLLFNELPAHAVNTIYNSSWTCVNTSDYWGGGQRTTLEALASGTPVVVMSDSIKNREYIEESGCGIVVEPNEEAIRNAIEDIKVWTEEQRMKGHEYIMSKWTHHHYADNISKAIELVLSK